MPKKKKRKSKAEKRLRQRKEFQTMPSFFDETAMKEDFCEIVEIMWDEMLSETNKKSEELSLHGNICDCCAFGWNILTKQQSTEEVLQYVPEHIAPKFPRHLLLQKSSTWLLF